ncbi:hypothetical protein D3C80_2092900 [compost metagenome]
MHDRQHGGHGIFCKQLLTGHNHNDKAEGVANIFDKETAGIVRQAGVKNAFRHQ